VVVGGDPMKQKIDRKPEGRWVMKSRLVFAIILQLVITGDLAHAQGNYLDNGNFDSNIDGWTLYGDASQTMEWDGSLGFPTAGSLRLTATNSTTIGPIAASECVAAPPGSSWELQAMVRRQPGSTELSCGLQFLLYFLPDCSDPTSAVVSGQTGAGTDWTPLNLDYKIPEGYEGIRAAPTMSVGLSANGACNFDSVRLTGPPNFAEVPALGPYTLAALVAALALAGLFWLRRAY